MNEATRANLTKIKTKEYYNDGILEKKNYVFVEPYYETQKRS